MVKTTIILEDELYKKLVREALERYGSTRKLSLLINEKLKKSETISTPKPKRRTTLKIGRSLSPKEIDELIERGLEESV